MDAQLNHYWLGCELCRLSVDMVVAPFCYSTERYKTTGLAPDPKIITRFSIIRFCKTAVGKFKYGFSKDLAKLCTIH